jgi:hypothetical protein
VVFLQLALLAVVEAQDKVLASMVVTAVLAVVGVQTLAQAAQELQVKDLVVA